MNFFEASTPTPDADGTYRWVVPPGWAQGRSLFGGLQLAAFVRAFEDGVTDPAHRLRSLTVTMCGGVSAGAAEIVTEVLRPGGGTTTMAGRLTQADALVAHGVAVFGKDRAADVHYNDVPAPEPGNWRAVAVAPVGPPLAPEFTRNFEYRTTGPFPFTNASSRSTCGWVRLKERGRSIDASYVAALLDAWWPGVFASADRPRPGATIVFTMQLFDRLEDIDPEAPFYYRAYSPVATDGYALEVRELWTGDGTLLAINQQTFVVLR